MDNDVTLDMVAPTLQYIRDDHGGIWEVTYAGMVRRHRQDWQAWWLYQYACALYAVKAPADLLPKCGTQDPAEPCD